MLKTRLTKNGYRWMISKGLAVLLRKALFFIHLARKYQSQRLKNLVGIRPHLAKLTFFSLSLCTLLLLIGLPASFSSLVSSSVAANPLYPLDANMVNVRDYGAKGDGITDDTAAIRRAVQDNLTKHRTLLFPTGTYLVSDSIEWKNKNGVFGAFLTWQGEGTDKTMIKLKDKAKGFGNPEQPRPITRPGSLGTRDTGKGNRAHNNYIFDMTFDTGKGNSGAIGVDFNASNTGAMENVVIVSGDGIGAIGLNLTREVGPCLIKNVTIKGFDIGIRGSSALYNVTLENIRLEHQNLVGIKNDNLVLAIRKLTSINSVPAISNGGDWIGPVVLIDSELRGGSPQAVAIENTSNILVRNVSVEGYKAAIKSGDKLIAGPKVEEFIAAPSISLFDSPKPSLNLPIEETPEFLDYDLNNWANVEDYGAKRDDGIDDSEGIQKAIDSGKTTIYFPWGYYHLNKPVIVRGNVHRMIGFFSLVRSPEVLFRFENHDHPVILERFNFQGGTLENAASQPVVVRHSSPFLETTSETGTWFLEDVVTSRIRIRKGQRVYARQLNCESPPPEPLLNNDGGLAWVFGYKTEYGTTVAATVNGGKSEILGGLFYPAQGVDDPKRPVILNRDSAVSAVYREIAFGSTYTIEIKETRRGKTKTLRRDQLDAGTMVAIPLYTGR
ncbi:glycoside hydrolase family 55 protein [Moorena sp. SIOASIH]|uniref:glycoside hydrolase family 55 protein n=1 Tax=Moorena sp. SIOASIH TaxID=2607817 RepID=UPI0025D5860D|nr:glycoside hydrolase family 55 protein [Moorena sp. SIOASIH]